MVLVVSSAQCLKLVWYQLLSQFGMPTHLLFGLQHSVFHDVLLLMLQTYHCAEIEKWKIVERVFIVFLNSSGLFVKLILDTEYPI